MVNAISFWNWESVKSVDVQICLDQIWNTVLVYWIDFCCIFAKDMSYNVFSFCFLVFLFLSIMLRTDSVSLSQEGELDSSILYDILPSSCPDPPVGSSNAFHAADIHQEEGKTVHCKLSDNMACLYFLMCISLFLLSTLIECCLHLSN